MPATRTIHPAEFKGWRPSLRDAALANTILRASTDVYGQPLEQRYDHSHFYVEDRKRLQDEFYIWLDQADDVLISHGLGHLSVDELLGDKAEHTYVLVRDGHGVAMTDDWRPTTREHKAAAVLQRLAQAQGPIGALADGERIDLTFM